jgi:hypothetical protein
VYAFVPGLEAELKKADATTELLDTTAFGEKVLTTALNLNGVAGELVAKVHHNAVFLIQKRFAATISGTSSSIAVKTGGELDFSYMDATAQDGATSAMEEPSAEEAVVEAPKEEEAVAEAPTAEEAPKAEEPAAEEAAAEEPKAEEEAAPEEPAAKKQKQ